VQLATIEDASPPVVNMVRKRRRRGRNARERRFRLALLVAYDQRCAYCAQLLLGYWTVDHIVPFSKGGTHTACNRVPCCKRCNREKAAHEGDELPHWMRERVTVYRARASAWREAQVMEAIGGLIRAARR
jgi:5-methylcytosine-specific restriction endonuclease McrA